MKYNICTVQPPGYVHARAFDEVAILVAAGLQDLGFLAEVNPNRIDPSARNILIGCHLLDRKSAEVLPDDSIIINTEQLSDEIGSWNANIFYWLNKYEAWDYSKKNITNIAAAGLHPPKHLMLGYHSSLEKINKKSTRDIDVLFYGSMNERRHNILQELSKNKLKVKHLFGVYGEDRDHWISRSKLILNIHFFQSKIFEIVRCFYLMINKMAIVSEIDDETSIDDFYRMGIHGTSYSKIVDLCVEYCENSNLREKLEEDSGNTIRRLPQAKLIAPLLDH